MNTATQTTPTTEQADRFRCEADVPDPPRDAAGRKQYWEDTVAEAVAELRRRLASRHDDKSFQALQMILDLEKTRIRHKAPVAGTQTTQTGGGRWADGLEPLPVYNAESDREFALKKSEPKKEDLTPPASAAPTVVEETVADAPVLPTSYRRGEVGCEATGRGTTSNETKMPLPGGRGSQEPPPLPSYPFPPKPARPIPLRERVKLQDGIIGHFHDHDDDWMLERGRRTRDDRPADYGQVNRATISCPPGWVPPPDYPPEMLPLDWVPPPPAATAGNDSGAGI